MLPKLQRAYTVCGSIASVYKEQYGVDFKVVRNLPQAKNLPTVQKKKDPRKMILYQGAINIGRGLEQAILAMHHIDNAKLVVAGSGDIVAKLDDLTAREKLKDKVEFTGRLPLEELLELTVQADLGLSIEEDLGLNYRFALPNKLFDYIQAQVPVLVTDLPEMAAIVKQYEVGLITQTLEPKELAQKITEGLNDVTKRKVWKKNLLKASEELVWKKEEKVLHEIFSSLL